RLNLLDRAPLQEGIVKQCQENGVGFISFSPLAQGLLTDRYLNGIPGDSRIAHDPRFLNAEALTPERLSQIRALNEMADRRGESLATMALAWVLQQKGVTSVIVGASSPEQLRNNLKAMGSAPFTMEEIEQINKLTK
ncbi:MAG: aldo/keto reductase, partial [Bacteroidaceae bacterium]|nr:aldo/keto reductase [Bacteroidaceae bacterium]